MRLPLALIGLVTQLGVAAADVAPAGDARPAHAIGPIVLEGSGEVPTQFVDRLRAELQTALEATEVRAVPRDAVGSILATMPDLGGCASRDCLTRFALATGSKRVVTTRLAITGELFEIAVAVVDDQGRRLRQRSARCVACSLGEAITKTSAAVAVLTGAEADDEVPVTVRTRPADAAITIDALPRGPAPWAGTLPAGPHTLTVTGERALVRELFVEAGTPVQLSLDVGGGHATRWPTYAAAGGSALAVVVGVSLLSIDGDGTCDQPTCPRLYETTALGWSLTGLGLVGLGGAGWLWWRDHHPARAFAVTPTDGGAAATISGRF